MNPTFCRLGTALINRRKIQPMRLNNELGRGGPCTLPTAGAAAHPSPERSEGGKRALRLSMGRLAVHTGRA